MNNQRGIQKRFVNDRFNLFIVHYLSFNDDKFNRVDVFVKTAQDGRIIVEVQNNEEDELMLTPEQRQAFDKQSPREIFPDYYLIKHGRDFVIPQERFLRNDKME
ncbi:MAG: hypothetical protein RIS64_190 [Bacteroidota bacterium]|jgi:hypothetical protein